MTTMDQRPSAPPTSVSYVNTDTTSRCPNGIKSGCSHSSDSDCLQFYRLANARLFLRTLVLTAFTLSHLTSHAGTRIVVMAPAMQMHSLMEPLALVDVVAMAAATKYVVYTHAGKYADRDCCCHLSMSCYHSTIIAVLLVWNDAAETQIRSSTSSIFALTPSIVRWALLTLLRTLLPTTVS